MTALVNPNTGKTVDVPDEGVEATLRAAGFTEPVAAVPKPPSRRVALAKSAD